MIVGGGFDRQLDVGVRERLLQDLVHSFGLVVANTPDNSGGDDDV